MYAIQLDLIEPNDEMSMLRKENSELRKGLENLRKGLFARHNDLDKRWIQSKKEAESLDRRLEMIERNISKK